MAIAQIPYGLLANGNYGVLLDPTTQKPLTSVIEVMTALPALADTDNFDGRLVFNLADSIPYIFSTNPIPQWNALKGIPATVDHVAGNPPVTPVPQEGELFWDLDTEVLFVWDGGVWQGAGGRYAAQVIENNYIGDGVTTNFASGSPSAIQTQYVEVFLDGVRQNASVDYNIVGTAVAFITAPAVGVNIYTRSLVSDGVVQNAQVTGANHTAVAGQTDFTTGVAATDPAGVFVFVNGVVQQLSTDYTLIQQNTEITTLIKTAITTAKVTTVDPHAIPVGSSVTLIDFVESDYDNRTFVVSSVLSVTEFEITVPAAAPAIGTPDGIAFFTPSYINDIVRFTTPMVGGELIDVRSLRNVVVSGTVGETNTLDSSGTGVPMHSTKVGVTLNVKSLEEGPNVVLTDLGDRVEIAANTGQGFEERDGTNSAVYVISGTTSYVGVRNTSTAVTINLAGVPTGPSSSGRKVTIKDESGGAGVNAITISAGGALIDGATTYDINTNYGSVTLVMDGTNWYITAARP